MANIPKFLICDNPMAENGQEYILHTQEPKALFKVIIGDDNTIEFVVAQEYDKLSSLSAKRLDGLMDRMARWFIEYDKYMDEVENDLENEMDDSGLNFKEPKFEDAHAMSILNKSTFQIPENEEIRKVQVGDFLKVAIAGERFWCKVIIVDQRNNIFFANIDNDLVNTDEHQLSSGDTVIIFPQHIYQIQKA